MNLEIVMIALAGWAQVEAQTRSDYMRECSAIASGRYETFMIFNPPGWQTYYRRSYCFQRAASELRDEMLCEEVRERKSVFFNGSGVSRDACLARVADQKERDRRDAEAHLAKKLHSLADFSIIRDGNGTDFDILVSLSGGKSGRYDLTVSAQRPSDPAAEIHAKNYGVTEDPTGLSIFLPRQELRNRLGAGWEQEEIQITAQWRYAPIHDNWAVRKIVDQRVEASRVTIAVRFSDLPPWEPISLDQE